jgi:hypothetical protein
VPSRQWETARRNASPENAVETEFVRLLSLPVDAKDRPGIVTRYNDMRNLFGRMYPATAQRMHTRMTAPNDPLGDFARYELADWHRKELLSLAQARGRELDRGMLDRATVQPPPPEPRPQRLPPPPIGGVPPRRIDPIEVTRPKPPPEDSTRKPPKKITDPRIPIQVPTLPKFESKSLYVSFKDLQGRSWLEKSLNGIASASGFVISTVMSVVPGAALEKIVVAAWMAYQLSKLTPTGLVGVLGEFAAEQAAVWVLESKMGIPAAKIFRLNGIAKNFPGLDLMTSRMPISVKTYGVIVSKATGEVRTRRLMSRYKVDALKLFDTNHSLHVSYQNKVADRLLKHRDQLAKSGAWPASLSGPKVTRDQVAKYVRDHGVMMVPEDHVGIVHMAMGRTYFEQYKQGLLPGFKAGLSDKQVAADIHALLKRRFISSGLTSSDYRAVAEVARTIPGARSNPRRPWPAEWGTPPEWSTQAMKAK